MKTRKAEQLARLVHYIAGRHPDEFGLVTDRDGFIPVGDLLKVLQEEGWHGVRRVQLETLSYHLGRSVIEFKDHLVRAVDRSRIAAGNDEVDGPRQLYAPVRRRAYEAVLQQGLPPQAHTGKVVLYTARELAQRVGKRRDANPLIVTVAVPCAVRHGHHFRPFGQHIFLSDALPSACCQLPRAPQMFKRRDTEKQSAPAPIAKTPGSYVVDSDPLATVSPSPKSAEHRHKSKAWKKKRQQERQWKKHRNRYG